MIICKKYGKAKYCFFDGAVAVGFCGIWEKTDWGKEVPSQLKKKRLLFLCYYVVGGFGSYCYSGVLWMALFAKAA